ncbi:hypothetical protein EYF80_045048 [Liparis tanakae]|uniref:Uncharacterized protein n=1 Tax=Liparis tanakae TaxID=230148 RepID=A0A4Z2FU49_9TELE|nr:hypothetical protein EYF80_045048 [Liparis tanakae]
MIRLVLVRLVQGATEHGGEEEEEEQEEEEEEEEEEEGEEWRWSTLSVSVPAVGGGAWSDGLLRLSDGWSAAPRWTLEETSSIRAF